jgi:hypothetical protein
MVEILNLEGWDVYLDSKQGVKEGRWGDLGQVCT